jgi:hypothetical protein
MVSYLSNSIRIFNHSLNGLPDVEVVFIFVFISVIYAFLLYNFLWITIGRLRLPDDSYFGVTIIGALTSLNAVLLTFTLVQAIGTYNKAQASVLSEISSIELFSKRLSFIPAQETQEIRHELRTYLDAVADSGWDMMVKRTSSDKSESAFSSLIKSIPHLKDNKEIDRDFLKEIFLSFNELVKSRTERLNMAGVHLPYYYLWGVCFLFTIHIIQFFLLTKRCNYSLIILELHMASLGLLLGFVFVYDHPFEGETSVKPETFRELGVKIEEEG